MVCYHLCRGHVFFKQVICLYLFRMIAVDLGPLSRMMVEVYHLVKHANFGRTLQHGNLPVVVFSINYCIFRVI